MTFFKAQKILTRLWFIWTGIIVLYLFKEITIGDFQAVAALVITWFSLYMAPVFSLILSSSFFKREWFDEQLKSKLFLYIALGTSIIYLTIITYCIYQLPESISSDGLTMTPAEQLEAKLESQGYLLKFLEAIVGGVLGYFFFSNKKEGTPSQNPTSA